MSLNKSQRWHLVNCGLMAGAVFLGGLSSGHFNFSVVMAALVSSGIVFISRFKDYWESTNPDGTPKEMQAVNPPKLGLFF